MLAALAYLENEDRLCRAANDNAAPSARAKLKFRLAAERRFDSQDQIPRYVYDASRKLVHVEDKNPKDGGAAERTDYMSVAGMDIARVITGQGIYYQHTDHLGSTVATTTSSGFLTAKERYTPFGETLDNPGLLSDQGGFTGHIKERDKIDPVNQFLLSATGLNYMQARYYDPVIGRFLSIDPVTFIDNGNPSYFNRYRYCANDPVNCFDPDGRTDIYIGGAKDQVVRQYTKDNPSSKGRTVGYFTAGDKKGAIAFARANAGNGEPLNIIGHSYGTVAAANVAQELGESGTTVNNLVGVDSVNKPFKTGGADSEKILTTVAVNNTGTGSRGDFIEQLGKAAAIASGSSPEAKAFKEGNATVFVNTSESHEGFAAAYESSGARNVVDDSYKNQNP